MSETESPTPKDVFNNDSESDAPTEPLEQEAPTEDKDQTDTPSEEDVDWKERFHEMRSINRKLENRLKAGKERFVGELEEKYKQELEDVRQQAEGKVLRYEVAAEKGIPLDLAGRLSGSTRDELAEDADALRKHINGSTSSAFAPGPREEPPAQHNPNDLIRAALRST